MIFSYKIKHNRKLPVEPGKARKNAQFAVEHRTISSKDPNVLRLKSVISIPIPGKYRKMKETKGRDRIIFHIPMGNRKMTTLSIHYSIKSQFLMPFVNLSSTHILKQEVNMTGACPVDGGLAPCIAGAVLVPEASSCFNGIAFGIPCALFFITVNAFPIVEVIAINYSCRVI
ncbi:MAG: hypothetical protein ACYCSO_05740 [Cuniculiplasma sp.]